MGLVRVVHQETSPNRLDLPTMLKGIDLKDRKMTLISAGFRLKMGLDKQTIDFSKCDNSKERMRITICVTSTYRRSNFQELVLNKFSLAKDRDSLKHIENSNELRM